MILLWFLRTKVLRIGMSGRVRGFYYPEEVPYIPRVIYLVRARLAGYNLHYLKDLIASLVNVSTVVSSVVKVKLDYRSENTICW